MLWPFSMGGYFISDMEKNNMIIRHNSGENFTVLNNEILQSTNMTFFSKGMLCYLLSLPKTWEINVAQLADRFGEKECRILRAFRELIELGYCMRKPNRENGRLRGQRYYVCDVAGALEKYFEKKENPSLFDDNTAPQENNIADDYTALPKNNTAAKTDPTEIGGANKELSDKKKINTYNRNKKTLFSENSVLANFDFVLGKFAGEEYKEVDIAYYYYAVRDWSDSSNTKRTENGWIATIRNFIRMDIERNKLHKKAQYRADAVIADEALQFLKM